jgi:hypothetical protein
MVFDTQTSDSPSSSFHPVFSHYTGSPLPPPINQHNPLFTSILHILAPCSLIQHLSHYAPLILFDFSTSYSPQNQSSNPPVHKHIPSGTCHPLLDHLNPDDGTDKPS